MGLLFIPEIAMKNMLDAILLFIRTDYNNSSDKDDSYLAQLLNGSREGKYDLYEQAVEVFINRGINHPKELQVHHFFNSERASIPTIHIVLPDDVVGPNSLGVDEGYQDTVYNSISRTTKETYNRTFDTRLHMVITSDNSFEVITIYHILRSALISTFNDLQFKGFQNPKISGGDLQINPELVPEHVFFRAINLDFLYDVAGPSIFTLETYGDFISQGIAISNILNDESSN